MSSSDPLDSITDWPMATQRTATDLLWPIFSAWILHLILFGLLQSQFSAYTSSALYVKDSIRVKLFLWTVVGIDFASVCLNAEQIFHYGTNQHRDHATLYVVRPQDGISVWLGALTAILVQSFLLKRASAMFDHHFLRWWLFVGLLSCLSALSFLAACGSFSVGIMWSYGLMERALPFTYNNLVSTWLMSTLAVDCSLCLTLVILLRKRFDTSLEKDSPVRRLISTTIQSAALPALFALVGGIMSCFPQDNDATVDVPLFWAIPLSSLYGLALVCTFAARTPHTPALVQGTVLTMGDIISPTLGTHLGGFKSPKEGEDDQGPRWGTPDRDSVSLSGSDDFRRNSDLGDSEDDVEGGRQQIRWA